MQCNIHGKFWKIWDYICLKMNFKNKYLNSFINKLWDKILLQGCHNQIKKYRTWLKVLIIVKEGSVKY